MPDEKKDQPDEKKDQGPSEAQLTRMDAEKMTATADATQAEVDDALEQLALARARLADLQAPPLEQRADAPVEPEMLKYTCKICRAKFERQSGLDAHVTDFHPAPVEA